MVIGGDRDEIEGFLFDEEYWIIYIRVWLIKMLVVFEIFFYLV